MYDADLEL